jgi:predicted enzyme related to lactoylglutathione lyase
MANPHGTFIWYELLTADAAAAADFYGKVVGWSVAGFDGQPATGPDDYRVLTAADGDGVGGILQWSESTPPGWLGYIGVDDVDAAVDGVVAAGGTVHMPARDLPGVGRFALLADPQGIVFYVMKGDSPEDSHAFGRMTIGHCSWNELLTPDLDAALAFYGSQFQIEKTGGMPMGEMGDYAFLGHAGEGIGAAMRNPPGTPAAWGFYFRVPDIDAAAERVTANGGTVVQGPMEVPGGEFILNAIDPQGAAFALVAPAKGA